MWKPGMPLCRVPSTSPSPRSFRSSSAMRKPSSVSRMMASRAFAVDAERRPVEQDTGRALGAAADAAAQLMQLRQPEALGMLDHHHARFGHVDADFDHRGRDQEPRLARGETLHGAILLGAAHAAVDQVDRPDRSASANPCSGPRRRRDRRVSDSSTSGHTQ